MSCENKGTLKIFTDGGSRGNGSEDSVGAWAYVLVVDDKNTFSDFGALHGVTNNQMELVAVIHALSMCLDYELINDDILLFSDSAYVVNGVNNWIKGWKKKNWKKADGSNVLNIELWKKLDYLQSKFNKLEILKIKGHSGNKGNEEADRLVNLAMDKLITSQ